MQKRGCTPLAKIVAHTKCGADPKIMVTSTNTCSIEECKYKQCAISDKSNFNTIFNVPYVSYNV